MNDLLLRYAYSAEAMHLPNKTSNISLRDRWSATTGLILRWLRPAGKMKQPKSASAGRRRRVLILDDDDSILSLLNVVLTNAGFECHLARDGHTGFELALALRPDLMIIDVKMPNGSGYDVLRMMNQNPKTSRMRTIMLTGCKQDADILRGYCLGAGDYVTKPFDSEEIVARVNLLLDRK
jgi:response regulator RpfG family c-di-GMP phosphodiesterase